MVSPADTATEVAPLDVVQRFWIALQTGDTAGAVALLDEDVVWRNTGLPTLRGRRVGAVLEGLDARGVAVEVVMRHIATAGDVVLTDRVDTIRTGPLATSFPVQGTFRVRRGRIVLWEDHFTWGSVGLATAGAVGGALAGLVGGVSGAARRLRPGR
ncbi:limonene-1,2-epoxide hydrolase family protein [Nocardioides sp. AX2bis]|uniref:limonene-1,2-epoxide hydrolase family protein n=1 Tax=Nocardioides sp. AX2bis TaxID=2653157 RepID=UPI0012F3F6A9|nr:limonene-1,2-epoxide hydrolase family protein [Nocardioides sp. AX2bis]VXA92437.1 Epoxide hydrolase [Nocardioides sp. AX2bis]